MPDSTSPAALPESLGNLIVEQISDALVYSDHAGIIRRWNAAATQLFGFTLEQTIGQSLDLIIPENLRAAHWRGFGMAMKSGTLRLSGKPTLTRALHASGAKLYVEMSFAMVRDEAGAVIGSVAMARDVTERVERERAARSSAAPKG